MKLTSSWSAIEAPGALFIDDEFDHSGDVVLEVRNSYDERACMWLNRDTARELRAHLSRLLGDDPVDVEAPVDPVPSDQLYDAVDLRIRAYEAVTHRLDVSGRFPDVTFEVDRDVARLIAGDKS